MEPVRLERVVADPQTYPCPPGTALAVDAGGRRLLVPAGSQPGQWCQPAVEVTDLIAHWHDFIDTDPRFVAFLPLSAPIHDPAGLLPAGDEARRRFVLHGVEDDLIGHIRSFGCLGKTERYVRSGTAPHTLSREWIILLGGAARPWLHRVGPHLFQVIGVPEVTTAKGRLDNQVAAAKLSGDAELTAVARGRRRRFLDRRSQVSAQVRGWLADGLAQRWDSSIR